MNVLVFGGLGFVGSNFVNWCGLNRPHWKLKIADGFTYAADASRIRDHDELEIRKARLEEPNSYSDLNHWADVVVNFAAETHNDNSIANPEPFLESNVNGVFNLLESIRNSGTRLIQISTDEVYGDFPRDSVEAASEDYPFRPSSPYSSSKAAGDLLVLAWVRTFKVNAIITHCTNNFGPGQHEEKLIPSILRSIERNTPIQLYGDGENVRDWLHVDDHSSAIALLLEEGRSGERYNIGADNHLSNVELAHMLSAECGFANFPIDFVSDRPGHDAKYSLDFSKIAKLGWKPAHTREAMENGMLQSLLK